MKKKIIFTMLSLFILQFAVMPATAAKKEKHITSQFIDSKGKVVTKYREDIVDEKEKVNTLTYTLPNPLLKAKKKTIKYISTLGPLNQFTEVQAKSQASDGIKRMTVTCTGFYKSGKRVGKVTSISPIGWKALIHSAYVKVPKNPFNYKIASATSVHRYDDSYYKSYLKELNWKKK